MEKNVKGYLTRNSGFRIIAIATCFRVFFYSVVPRFKSNHGKHRFTRKISDGFKDLCLKYDLNKILTRVVTNEAFIS